MRELATPMLFGGAVLIVVRPGGEVLKHITSDLSEFLERKDPPPNRAVFFAANLDGRTKLARRLNKLGGIVKCRRLYATPAYWQKGSMEDSELSRFAVQRARTLGLMMSPQAAGFLAAHTGNDLFRVDSELQKILLSLPPGKTDIELEEIERITGLSATHTPFDLWEKLEEGDVRGALDTLSVILRNGLRSMGGKLETDAAGISAILLGMLRERVRLSARVALLQWEKQADEQIMKKLKISSSFYLSKLKATARRLTASKLKTISEALLSAERRIKRMGHGAVPVMEETVLKLTRAGK
jgi:DNA polymerase III delta subunit